MFRMCRSYPSLVLALVLGVLRPVTAQLADWRHSGSSPHTSEAWFRADRSNADVLAWGPEARSGDTEGDGRRITLKLKSASNAKTITYLKEINWNQNTLLMMQTASQR